MKTRLLSIQTITFIVLAIFYATLSIIYVNNVPPKGDEIHFLLLTKSIVVDHNFYLESRYTSKDYSNFYQGKLDQHSVVGLGGHQYSTHDPGLSILASPFFAIAGRLGVSLANSLLTVLLIFFIFKFSSQISQSFNVSLLVALALALNLPFAQYASIVMPEMVSALAILVIANFLPEPKKQLLVSFLAALLIWFNIRFLLISLVVVSYQLFANKKGPARIKLGYLLIILSVLAYFMVSKIFYGTFWPSYRYWDISGSPLNLAGFIENPINILIDRQYGLLVATPIFIFVGTGLPLWYKKEAKSFFTILLLSLVYLATILGYRNWNGGYSPPPARYIIPILPLWVPAIALSLNHYRSLLTRFLAVIFATWGLADFIISIGLSPNHGFVYQDGVSPFLWFLYQKTSLNFHQIFPAFFPKEQLSVLHLIWIVLIVGFIFLLPKIDLYFSPKRLKR